MEQIVYCEKCKRSWIIEDGDVILMPWPHIECPECGEWIPLF